VRGAGGLRHRRLSRAALRGRCVRGTTLPGSQCACTGATASRCGRRHGPGRGAGRAGGGAAATVPGGAGVEGCRRGGRRRARGEASLVPNPRCPPLQAKPAGTCTMTPPSHEHLGGEDLLGELDALRLPGEAAAGVAPAQRPAVAVEVPVNRNRHRLRACDSATCVRRRRGTLRSRRHTSRCTATKAMPATRRSAGRPTPAWRPYGAGRVGFCRRHRRCWRQRPDNPPPARSKRFSQ